MKYHIISFRLLACAAIAGLLTGLFTPPITIHDSKLIAYALRVLLIFVLAVTVFTISYLPDIVRRDQQ